MPNATTVSRLDAAVDALRAGRPVLLFDSEGREAETDLVYASECVTPEAVRTLRTQAGGLLCTTLAPRVHQALGLPYLADVLRQAAHANPVLARLTDAQVPYEDASNQKPSFGLTINHRDTFTGVTDADRSMTIMRLAALALRVGTRPDAELADDFVRHFKAPGHVFLLNAHPRMMRARKGHTELATALVEMAGLAPSATICEMMDGPGGAALPRADAVKYAASNGRVFLTGDEVTQAWAQRNPQPSRNGTGSV